MNEAMWRSKVLEVHPTAGFVTEDGTGKTYGEPGDVVAYLLRDNRVPTNDDVGPDMQDDVVGIWIPGDFCWYENAHGEQPEFSTKEE